MLVSKGNKKLGKDTLIINITSASDCPSKALGLCKVCKICYAMKAERMYKQTLPYRRSQAFYWFNHTAEEIAADFRVELKRKSKVPIKYIRFSEAGDFKSQADVEKMFNIAQILEDTGVIVYGYTARKDLNFDGAPKNLVLQGSGFMVHNSFTATAKKDIKAGDIVCPGNCRICSKCKERNGLDIKVINH